MKFPIRVLALEYEIQGRVEDAIEKGSFLYMAGFLDAGISSARDAKKTADQLMSRLEEQINTGFHKLIDENRIKPRIKKACCVSGGYFLFRGTAYLKMPSNSADVVIAVSASSPEYSHRVPSEQEPVEFTAVLPYTMTIYSPDLPIEFLRCMQDSIRGFRHGKLLELASPVDKMPGMESNSYHGETSCLSREITDKFNPKDFQPGQAMLVSGGVPVCSGAEVFRRLGVRALAEKDFGLFE